MANSVRMFNNCLVWTGTTDKDGYPLIVIDGKRRRVCRYILELKLGHKILPEMLALHTCNHESCVEQDHLYEGTVTDNNRDTVKAGHHKTWGRKPNNQTLIPTLQQFLNRSTRDLKTGR